ncbi:MAG: DUF262 domain-containing protein [Spirochaetaceae bacterium]|nr:DUF262 domain-containing protein [Spirochaetaceae bacterium]
MSQLLSNSRYGLDFYQREYSWQEIQVTELIDDLATRFLDQYNASHARERVASYRPYFLGPIVTAQRDGVRYLVDGQQRITTLSLLLMFLRHRLRDEHPDDANSLDSLIFSSTFGKTTFNLDVDERNSCLRAILNDEVYEFQNEPQSVRTIGQRYETIWSFFPDDLQGDQLPYFTDWLQHRVMLVDIGTPDQDMALEIFETMNDRGLRLNAIDMLKSYLLARVGDENQVQILNDRWRRRVTELADVERNADAEFVKAWLRGKYARTQRDRKAHASPGDFDIIGTAFHKWVRDNASVMSLSRSEDYQRIVERGFLRLSSRYLRLLKACQTLDSDLKSVYYVGQTGFTLLLPVVLAAITPEDDDAVFFRKAELVAAALDIFIVRRMVNFSNYGYSTVAYTMFNLIKGIRDSPIAELRETLADWLEGERHRLDGICSGYYGAFGLTQRNRKYIYYILARITSWLDGELATGVTFADYVDRSRKHPFEVEHIWSDHFDRYAREFRHEQEFQTHRNRIGGLLLLPKDFNASFGDMKYAEKVQHYNSQNPLARSLHPLAYENNPSFVGLCETHRLEFKPYATEFTRADIDERQRLYQQLAEIVWDPARLGLT